MKLYKKVNRSVDNIYGIEEVKDNPFYKPSLLCIPSTDDERNMFGTLKRGLSLARVRTYDMDYGAGYDISDIPINFLVLECCEVNDAKEFVDKYLVPLVSDNNIKIDINKAIKNIRNINIFSYCYGTKFYLLIEKYFKKSLLSLGYNLNDANNIINNISLCAIATDAKTKRSDAIVTRILDVYDDEAIFHRYCFEEMADYINSYNLNFFSTNESKRNKLTNIDIYYADCGYHFISKVLDKSCICLSIGSVVVYTSLNNSLLNYYNDSYYPLDMKEILKNLKELIGMKRTISNKEIIDNIDRNINYYNLVKHELSEIKEFENNEENIKKKIKEKKLL